MTARQAAKLAFHLRCVASDIKTDSDLTLDSKITAKLVLNGLANALNKYEVDQLKEEPKTWLK